MMYTYEEYINKVINKELPVCQAAFLSVKRHLDDIEKSKNNDYPFYFDDTIFSTYKRRMGKS